MKPLIFLLLSMLFNVGYSQYTPLIKENAVWRTAIYTGKYPTDYQTDVCQFTFSGDTLIDSVKFKKLYSTSNDSIPADYKLVGVMREDSSGKVYFIRYAKFLNEHYALFCYPNDSVEFLLYDFGMKLGDTLEIYHPISSHVGIVSNIDTIDIQGQKRRRLSVGSDAWIEGIGSTKGLLYPTCYEFEWNYDLGCYYDTSIFYSDSYSDKYGCHFLNIDLVDKSSYSAIKIYPNPAQSSIKVENLEQGSEIEIYTLDGKLKKRVVDYQGYPIVIESIEPGFYNVCIRSGFNLTYKKLIVNR